MKKLLKWLVITILALIVLVLAAAIVIPIVFKPQLLELAKKEINASVKAKIDFSDFSVSILKGFPDVYIGLKNLRVVGVDEFDGDTLVAFREFSVRVDIKTIFAMENIVVKSVLLDSPVMMAKINAGGKVNWDIAVTSEESTPEKPTAEPAGEPSTIKAALKKFEIKNAHISYVDEQSNMKAVISNLNFALSGNMGLDQTELTLNTTIEKFNFYMNGIRFMRDAALGFDAQIAADLTNSVYAFKQNVFSLNELQLKFDGEVRMPTDDIDVNLTYATNRADFKTLLSLVPAIYMNDFAGLKTSGQLQLDGWVKGAVTDTTLPSVALNLVVENARFQYPDLPKSVENVGIVAKVFYDGANDDKTTVDVSRFHLELSGNPFDATLAIRTPMTDMQFDGTFKGTIDFNTLADVIPLEETTIKGVLVSNLEFGGLMSYVEKEQYDKFKADGLLKLSGFEYSGADFPQGVKINETTLNFTPRFVQLANFDAQIGKSDIRMDGRLENFIPFALKDETLKGKLNLYSRILDLNEFMTEDATPEAETPQDTVPMSVIEIPKNIDFVMASQLNKILFDKLEIDNVKGEVIVRNGAVKMNNVNMSMLQGTLALTGEYNTQNPKAPAIDFGMDIRNFDIPSAVRAFSSLEKLAPQVKNLTGNISTKMTLNALLDSAMSPILKTVNAKGRFNSQNIAIVNSKVFGKAADLLKNDDFRNPRLKSLDAGFTVKDGVVNIEPFDTEVADMKMNFGGTMNLEQAIDFRIKLDVPKSKLGPASDALGAVSAAAAAKGLNLATSDRIKVNLKVGGTATDPKVGLDGGEATQGVKDQVKEVVTQQVDKAKEEARKKAREEADKLIADAEKQAETIRKEAEALAAKIRAEADTKAKKVEDEAKGKNPLVQQAAKKSAEQIRKEGDEAAKKVIREADSKAQSLIDKAKEEAEKLTREN